jgi:ATP-dependent helicase YprA (DUF1998 family)
LVIVREKATSVFVIKVKKTMYGFGFNTCCFAQSLCCSACGRTKCNSLIEIFEKALSKMENCSCKDDNQKDGCYHCLYAYRQSQQIGNISRRVAISLLKSILSGKDRVKKINKINDIPINPLFDSELEQRFMEAVRTKVGAANVND